MSFGNCWQHVEAKIVAESDKAFLLDIEDCGEVWVPLSQIADPETYRVGDFGTVSLTDFIAEKLGISE